MVAFSQFLISFRCLRWSPERGCISLLVNRGCICWHMELTEVREGWLCFRALCLRSVLEETVTANLGPGAFDNQETAQETCSFLQGKEILQCLLHIAKKESGKGGPRSGENGHGKQVTEQGSFLRRSLGPGPVREQSCGGPVTSCASRSPASHTGALAVVISALPPPLPLTRVKWKVDSTSSSLASRSRPDINTQSWCPTTWDFGLSVLSRGRKANVCGQKGGLWWKVIIQTHCYLSLEEECASLPIDSGLAIWLATNDTWTEMMFFTDG